MTNGSEFPTVWNGNPIPPRPPLPADGEPSRIVDEPTPAKFKIGMPPGMDFDLDTVPSSDIPTPVTPVAKPAFGPAPTPLSGVPQQPGQNADLSNPRLVLPDGTVLPLAGGLIVGRDPRHQEGYWASTLASLHDVERSVSKTHAVLGVSEGRVWVIDLNSTNGTFMVAPNGALTPCVPEVATPVDAGADIRFGEYRVRVALD